MAKVKRICKQCGKEFFVPPHYVKRGGGKFCSYKCTGLWYSEHRRGKNHPLWKRIKHICQFCGKEFEVIPSKRGKFCCKSCTSKFTRKKTKMPTHHTKPELIFEQICKKNNLDFHYVGDGQLWIGKDKVLNPDFIEANGKKICIEIMGDYWHSPLLNPKIKKERILSYREKHYKKYKWQPVFIWDTDLLRKDAEEFVLNILRREI